MATRVRCKCPKPCCVCRCVACKKTWESYPEGVACEACGSLYVEWVNYEAWRKKHPLKIPGRTTKA